MIATDERDTERERLIAEIDSDVWGSEQIADLLLAHQRADAGKDETIRKLREALGRASKTLWIFGEYGNRTQLVKGEIARIAATLAATTQPVKDGGATISQLLRGEKTP